jgi:PAS domain S-box-containing protein
MTWQFAPYVFPIFLASAAAAWLAYYAFGRRDRAPGVPAFALFCLGVCVWMFFKAIELLGADPGTKLFWLRMEYLGIGFVPASWLVFTWQYTHHERRLSRRALGLLAIHPVLVLLSVWTNDLHHLHWRTFEAVDNGLYIATRTTQGPFFWLHTAYSYVTLVFGTVLIARMLLHYRAEHLYGRQALALLVGGLVPLLGNVLSVFRLNPFPAVESSSLAFVIGAASIAYGIFQHGLLDVVPLAHNAIIRHLLDGIVVLDAEGRVVELNPAAERIVGKSGEALLGQSASTALFADHPELVRHYTDLTENTVRLTLGETAVRHYDVGISAVADSKGHLAGRALTLHDVTLHVIEHAQLTEALAEVQRAHEALEREHAELQAFKRDSAATAN